MVVREMNGSSVKMYDRPLSVFQILGFPGVAYNVGELYHPDNMKTQHTAKDVVEVDTTEEMEGELVKEMSAWVAQHTYTIWWNDCFDFTDHFEQRAKDLVEVQKVKQGQMSFLKFVCNTLWRNTTPSSHITR